MEEANSVAIYCRLGKDDLSLGESSSITTQKTHSYEELGDSPFPRTVGGKFPAFSECFKVSLLIVDCF